MFLNKKLFAVFLFLGLLVFSFSTPALAQYGLEETAKAADLSTESGDLPSAIGSFISIALGVLGVIFLCLMLYAGWLWMTAMGDNKKVQTAKDLIIAAVSGIIVIVLAYAVTSFVLDKLSRVGNTATEETAD